jgi:hypothetical protein
VAGRAVSVDRAVGTRRRTKPNSPNALGIDGISLPPRFVGPVRSGLPQAVNQTKAVSVRTGTRGELFGVGISLIAAEPAVSRLGQSWAGGRRLAEGMARYLDTALSSPA